MSPACSRHLRAVKVGSRIEVRHWLSPESDSPLSIQEVTGWREWRCFISTLACLQDWQSRLGWNVDDLLIAALLQHLDIEKSQIFFGAAKSVIATHTRTHRSGLRSDI
jgi:hypothetical protein